MSNGGSNKYDNDNEHSGSRTPSDEADDANDEDHTARLQFDRHKSVKATYADENASALQRVKSLTQRNRLVRVYFRAMAFTVYCLEDGPVSMSRVIFVVVSTKCWPIGTRQTCVHIFWISSVHPFSAKCTTSLSFAGAIDDSIYKFARVFEQFAKGALTVFIPSVAVGLGDRTRAVSYFRIST